MFALARVGLADAYVGLCNEGCLEPEKTFEMAHPLLVEAIKLDSTLPEAYASMGLLLQEYRWDWAGAEECFKKALELNPNWGDVCHSYGDFLALRGRFDEAIEEMRRASETRSNVS